MEDERIRAVKTWPEPKSAQDIQVFIGFANFYRPFIQGFSRIAVLLTLMSKITSPTSFPAGIGASFGAHDKAGGDGGEIEKTVIYVLKS